MIALGYITRQKLALGSSIAGAIALPCIAALLGSFYKPANDWDSGILPTVLFGAWPLIPAFAGAFLGLIVGSIVATLFPKPTTSCPACGSTNAIAADRSFLTGRKFANRCPDCRHSW